MSDDHAAAETRVLVLAPTGRDGELLMRFLQEFHISGVLCCNGRQLLQELAVGAAVLLIAQEAIDEDLEMELLAFVQAQPQWSDLPILLLTKAGASPVAGDRRVAELGNVTTIERPAAGGPLLTAVQTAMRARRRQYEVREHLRELKSIHAELLQANRRKDELLGLVSHELRTPLTLIIGSASVLARHGDEFDSATRDELLGAVRDSSNRLARVIENMLVLAKAEVNGEVDLEPFLVQRSLPTVIDSIQPLAGGRRLCVQIGPTLPPVLGNALFFEQIVQNLIRNSEKYSSEEGVIEVTAAFDDPFVTISVADRGKTFTQRQVDQMFETFYRDPEAAARVSGLGLGLPVCKRLAEAQRGTVRGVARRGGGLRVILTLRTDDTCSDAATDE